jgi:UDP-glucose 4-epimerase
MKILVIGSKGFIGAHLIQALRLKQHETFGCDVVVEYNDAHYFQVDATNASYEDIFDLTEFDICINCSGAASVPDSFAHPLRDYNLNTRNVYLILDAIRKHQPRCKFLNLSSAAVYGNPDQLPVTEQMLSRPLSPYGWHKYYAEMICEEFYSYFNIATCSVRIFSAFGPGLRKQLFWDWYQKINQNPSVTLFGTGRESRDFIYIDDLIRAILCIAENGTFQSEVINVANGKEILIADAIEIFKSQSGISFTYTFNNEVRTGDPLNWCADINTLTALGYRQQVTFEEGIKRYIQWLRVKE